MLIWNNLINYTIGVGMIIEECNLTFDPDMLVNINSYREYHPKEHFSTLGPPDYQCSKINLHGNRRVCYYGGVIFMGRFVNLGITRFQTALTI